VTVKSLLVNESFVSLTTLKLKDLCMLVQVLFQEDRTTTQHVSVGTLVIIDPVILQPLVSVHAVFCGK